MGNSLRDRAVALGGTHEGRSGIDSLLSQLTDKERADVLDLLVGTPRLAHTAVATVLAEEFEQTLTALDITITAATVKRWRANPKNAKENA